MLEGLKIIVHAEGHKVTARWHVKRQGGTLVTAGEGAHFLCLDTYMS
jgi:hypothetical protein